MMTLRRRQSLCPWSKGRRLAALRGSKACGAYERWRDRRSYALLSSAEIISGIEIRFREGTDMAKKTKNDEKA
jgi:hypothetical protein